MSPGNKSGVHWTRAKRPPMAAASGQRRFSQPGQVFEK
jgi:hypothetical protein